MRSPAPRPLEEERGAAVLPGRPWGPVRDPSRTSSRRCLRGFAGPLEGFAVRREIGGAQDNLYNRIAMAPTGPGAGGAARFPYALQRPETPLSVIVPTEPVSDPLPASHRPLRPPPPAGPATGPARALPGPPQVASLRESFRLAPGVGPSGALPGGVLKVRRPGPSARPSAAGGSRVPHRPGVPAVALFPKGLADRFPPPSEGVYQGPPSRNPSSGHPLPAPLSTVSREALPARSAGTLRRPSAKASGAAFPGDPARAFPEGFRTGPPPGLSAAAPSKGRSPSWAPAGGYGPEASLRSFQGGPQGGAVRCFRAAVPLRTFI